MPNLQGCEHGDGVGAWEGVGASLCGQGGGGQGLETRRLNPLFGGVWCLGLLASSSTSTSHRTTLGKYSRRGLFLVWLKPQKTVR